MSLDSALMKVLEKSPNDLLHFLSSFPATILLRQKKIKGSSGGASGQIEYIGYAPADALLAENKWLIVKLVYDSGGFNTDVVLADGEAKFNKVFDTGSSQYANYTYTIT